MNDLIDFLREKYRRSGDRRDRAKSADDLRPKLETAPGPKDYHSLGELAEDYCALGGIMVPRPNCLPLRRYNKKEDPKD